LKSERYDAINQQFGADESWNGDLSRFPEQSSCMLSTEKNRKPGGTSLNTPPVPLTSPQKPSSPR